MQQTEITWPKSGSISENHLTYLEVEKEFGPVFEQYTLLKWHQVKSMYNQWGRYYHNWDHIKQMLTLARLLRPQIEKSEASYYALNFAILFHDVIYVPGSKSNEKLSAAFFKGALRSETWPFDTDWINNAILNTEYSLPDLQPFGNPKFVSFWLQQIDLNTLMRGTRRDQIVDFVKVWFEFADLCQGDKWTFEAGQNWFLTELAKKFDFAYEPITWKEVYASKNEDDLYDGISPVVFS
jgi:hypothetical protein